MPAKSKPSKAAPRKVNRKWITDVAISKKKLEAQRKAKVNEKESPSYAKTLNRKRHGIGNLKVADENELD